MDKQEEMGVLVKEKEYVKYVQLLKKAEEEGRLDGKLCVFALRYAFPNKSRSPAVLQSKCNVVRG